VGGEWRDPEDDDADDVDEEGDREGEGEDGLHALGDIGENGPCDRLGDIGEFAPLLPFTLLLKEEEEEANAGAA
jgi:hypothetical protein